METSSKVTTEGITVEVTPEFLENESAPDINKYLWAYRILIENEGDSWAKLISRHWVIINAEGDKEDVKGPGVVGYTPELKPGDTFTYTSFCPLDTPWGTMEGSYTLIRRDSSEFKAKIGRFYLVSPHAKNI